MECPSCGASDQHKARCEACGFAFPQAVATDDALSLFLGLVCAVCDTYNDPGTTVCVSCNAVLEVGEPAFDIPATPLSTPPQLVVLFTVPSPATTLSPSLSSGPHSILAPPPSWMTPPTGQPLATNLAMKKVDLATIAETSNEVSFVAPIATPMPTMSPLPPSTLPPPPPPSTPSPPTPQPSIAPLSIPSPSTPPPSIPSPSIPSPSIPSPSIPSPSPSAAAALCWRCSATLEPHDKFCRQCGARVDAPEKNSGPVLTANVASLAKANSAIVTQMMQALKLPDLGRAAPASSTSTMVMPAMKFAASSPVAGHAQTGGPTATMVFGVATVERVAKLILVRGHSQFGSQWRLQSGETVIGRTDGMVLFPDDTALATRHARLVWRGVDLMLEPEHTTNGVYLRLRQPVRLQAGDEFLVGAQRLRVLANQDRPQAVEVATDGTRLLGSVIKPNPPISLLKITSDERFNELYFRAQRLLTIGRTQCDVNFDGDGFVSERHAQLTHEGTHLTLEDLGSRNGTYVRARTAIKLAHGDLLLLGDQVLRIELPQR